MNVDKQRVGAMLIKAAGVLALVGLALLFIALAQYR